MKLIPRFCSIHVGPNFRHRSHRIAAAIALSAVYGCGTPDPTRVITPPPPPPVVTPPTVIPVIGKGTISTRYSAEVWSHGNTAYTTTWGSRGTSFTRGNTIYLWDVTAPATPALIDSVLLASAGTIGDVQVTADGSLMVVPTEGGGPALAIYRLTQGRSPQLISQFNSAKITQGVHTAEVQTIAGRTYVFCSVNRGASHPARLMIVDITDPTQPVESYTRDITRQFLHDVFVRDGILFLAQWNDGVFALDIGGGGKGGTITAPVELGSIVTNSGSAHNMWWFHDPSNSEKKYLFVGEEGPATLFTASSGDIHVVDVTSFSQMREVAFFHVAGAGTHNFVMDEARGILYAAFYNGGVRALNVRGDLAGCTTAQKALDGRCDLALMGRNIGVGTLDQNAQAFIWGVHLNGNTLFASDMNNGLWVLRPN